MKPVYVGAMVRHMWRIVSDMPTARDTAARFRTLRIRRGLSVPQLAVAASKAAGRPIYPKTLYRIEAGELTRAPHLATVSAVAAALNVSVTDLLGPEVLDPCA